MSEWQNSAGASFPWPSNHNDMEGDNEGSYSLPSTSFSTISYGNSTALPYDQYTNFSKEYEYDSTGTPNSTTTFATGAPRNSEKSKITFEGLGWSLAELLDNYRFILPKRREPYFELIQGTYTWENMPGKVYLDPPSNPQDKVYPCLYPGGCSSTAFKRPADLERHYRNVHVSKDQKERFPCDYKSCARAKEPFQRKDHFRDHLRDYHKEDIGCAKGEKSMEKEDWLLTQTAWLAERKIEAKWWRCPKCLRRVQISKAGYECQHCKMPCDAQRKMRIEAERQTSEKKSVSGSSTAMGKNLEEVNYLPKCATCNDTSYVMNMKGTYDPCTSCQVESIGMEAYGYGTGNAWDKPSAYSKYDQH